MRLTFLAPALVAFALPAVAADPDASTVLARVGDTEITLGHVISLMDGLPEQYRQMPDEQLFEGLMGQLVDQAALAQTQKGGDLAMRLAMQNQERGFLASRAIEGFAASVTESQIRTLYDAQLADAIPTREMNASHILVKTEEEALALIETLEGGADFAELARSESTGPSGPNGGQLGWFGEGQMVAPFEEAVQAMEPGTISAPVETQFGWHVIRLNEVRDLPVPSFEEVRDEIGAELADARVREGIKSVRDAAKVEMMTDGISPALIRETGLIEGK